MATADRDLRYRRLLLRSTDHGDGSDSESNGSQADQRIRRKIGSRTATDAIRVVGVGRL